MELSLEELESATEGFSVDRLIGKGSHGCVYKGILNDGMVVAVKKPSMGVLLLQDTSKLDNEIDILSSVRCPLVVNLLAVVGDSASSTKILVTEFMPHGSLEDYLHGSSRSPPPWATRMAMALQLAEALSALHESTPPIIHRDVKPANILLDSSWTARIADFGLAVRGAPTGESQQDCDLRARTPAMPAGTMGYMDPCYTKPAHLSDKVDVYSFGVVLFEIVSGRRALDVASYPASIINWAVPLIEDGRMREVCDSRVALPHFMERAVRRLLAVAARCVSLRTEERPSMAEVVLELEAVFERGQSSLVGLPRWWCLVGRWRCGQAKCRKKQTSRDTKLQVTPIKSQFYYVEFPIGAKNCTLII